MSRNTTLLKNTLIILFGKVCTQLISYLLLPVYTTVLTTEEYGTVDLLITYIALIAPITTLQMEAAVFRFLIDVRQDSRGVYRIITNSLICIGGTIGIALIGYTILVAFLEFRYAIPFAVCILANALISIFLQIARGLGDNITYAVGSAISGIFTIVFNILFIVVFPFGIVGMLSATALAQILGTIYIIIKLKIFRFINFRYFDFLVIKEMLRYSLPLIPNSLSWWIISVSDRTLVTVFLGVQANGLLAVATKFATIIVNVFAIFNLSWTESVAVHIHDKDGDRYISRISNQCFKLFGAGGVLLILGCGLFFDYLIGPDFLEAYDLIPILVIGSVLNVLQTLYGIIYIGLKDTKQTSKSSLMAALVNLAIDLLLINVIGLYAAAISTVCAMLFLSVYRYIDVNKYIKIRVSSRTTAVLCIMYAFACSIYYYENTILIAVWLILTFVFCLFWNKKMIKDVMMMVMQKSHRFSSLKK